MIKLDEYILTNNLFCLNAEAADVKSALKIGVDLLINHGSVEPRYYDNIIKAYEEMGPYFVIAPSLAMPHARPEDGALENCFSLVILKEPMVFGSQECDPVKVLLTIAATEAKSMNKEVIMQIAELFDCDEAVNLLIKASTKEELKAAFEKWRELEG